ncbi:MAG: hypothetical protein ACKO96_06060, partial [Flammeovirgaceae bacterium]
LLAAYSESSWYIDTGGYTDRLNYWTCRNMDYVAETYPPSGYGQSITQSSYYPQFLNEVIFPDGKLQFFWAPREDIMNEKRLYKMQIVNRNNDLIKSIDFDNASYFYGSPANRPNFSYANGSLVTCNFQSAGLTENDVQLKRLKLRSITFSDLEQPYRFYYDEQIPLPAKMAYAADYWGYYNGNNNATSLLPDLRKLFLIVPSNLIVNIGTNEYFINPQAGSMQVQDRRADINYAKAWTLNKIQYPTGGHTEVEYELNTADNFDFAGKGDFIESNAYANITYYGSLGNVSTSGTLYSNFTLIQRQTVDITYKFDLRLIDNQNPNLNSTIQLVDANQNIIFEDRFRGWSDPIPPTESCLKPERKKYLELLPGAYQVRIVNTGTIQSCVHTGMASSSTISVNVAYRNAPNGYVAKGGGLRIKRLKDFDGFRYTSIRRYDYSGGLLMDNPNFFRTSKIYKWETPSAWACWFLSVVDNFDYLLFSGHPVSGIATGPVGNYVGYSIVTEYLENEQGQSEGYTKYHFNNSTLNCNEQSLAPCTPRLDNGLLIKKEIFRNDGFRIQLDSNSYETTTDHVQNYSFLVESSSFGAGNNVIQGGEGHKTYLLHTYPIIGEKTRLKSTMIKKYSGSQVFTTTVNYTYNNRHLVLSEKYTGSDGAELQVNYTYPMNHNTSIYSAMVNNNQINSLITREEVKTLGQSSQQTLFEQWGYNL